MSCFPACLIGAGFIGGKLAMMASGEKKELHDNFVNTLSQEQQDIYSEIASERMKIYLQGMGLGLALALGYLFMSKNLKTTDVTDICIFVVISGAVSYGYYTLSPKSKYMLNYIDRPDQIAAWLEIYKTYKYKTSTVRGAHLPPPDPSISRPRAPSFKSASGLPKQVIACRGSL